MYLVVLYYLSECLTFKFIKIKRYMKNIQIFEK